MFDRLREFIGDWISDWKYRRRPRVPSGPPYEGSMEFTGPDGYGIGDIKAPNDELLLALYYAVEPDTLSEEFEARIRAHLGLPPLADPPLSPPDIGPRDSVEVRAVSYEQRLEMDKRWTMERGL